MTFVAASSLVSVRAWVVGSAGFSRRDMTEREDFIGKPPRQKPGNYQA